MIIHRLILYHLQHRDDPEFYLMQARDAIAWIQRTGCPLTKGMTVLDLGCGHGVFGEELSGRGCKVTFADDGNHFLPSLAEADFRTINLDRDDVSSLGTYDRVVCSHVFEHRAKPERFLSLAGSLLRPAGRMYLSWTNWLSLWGGHEFSPLRYLGPKLGCRVYDKLSRRPRLHTPGINLFPTYIGSTRRRTLDLNFPPNRSSVTAPMLSLWPRRV